MLRVYCDTGGYRNELSTLERDGLITVYQYKYENRNRGIVNAACPSNPTWKEANYTWAEAKNDKILSQLTWESIGETSVKFPEIVAIVGKANRVDAKHLDSAYRTECTVFLTSDKDDIWSNREAIRALIGIHVLHVSTEWNLFLELVRQ